MSAVLLSHAQPNPSLFAIDSHAGPVELAAELRQRFEDYNAEFTHITRRAARHFLARDWPAARADAVQRIELYEQHVSRAIEALRQKLGAAIQERALWVEIKRQFDAADRLPAGQRLLPDVPELDHTRRVRDDRRG